MEMWLIFAGLLAGMFFCARVAAGAVFRTLIGDYRLPLPLQLLFAAAESGLMAFCFHVGAPLPLFYLVLYAGHHTMLRAASSAAPDRLLFVGNLVTALLFSTHLLCLGGIALWTGDTLREVYTDPVLWFASLSGALAVLFCVLLFLGRSADPASLAGLAEVAGRQKEVGYSAWLAVVYLFFDSFACFVNPPYRLVAWFIIGSCLLLWLQLAIFLIHVYHVSMRQHYENEHRMLEQQRAEQIRRTLKLRKIAYIDGVTGAFTRNYVMGVLRQWLRESKRFCLAYIDLNGLKTVNDTWGHDAGDEYLASAAEGINRRLRAADVLARVGGDEFLVLMPDVRAAEAAAVLREAARTLREEDSPYPRAFSFGVEEATAPGEDVSAEELIRRADRLMYEDKRTSRGTDGAGERNQ